MLWSVHIFVSFFVLFYLMFLTQCIQQTEPRKCGCPKIENSLFHLLQQVNDCLKTPLCLNDENLKKIVVKVKRIDSTTQSTTPVNSVSAECSTEKQCKDLKASCLHCNFNFSCIYGAKLNVTCTPGDSRINCKGEREFKREMTCSYCYQTPHWDHVCTLKANCNTVAAPKVYYRTNCTVKDDILCLGKRTFNKNLPCNWTGGYKWSTAVMLSITLGGFGADRFYLGHWQEGIGKLFSFGGLGVWTLIDVILILLRYLGPADGSLYI